MMSNYKSAAAFLRKEAKAWKNIEEKERSRWVASTTSSPTAIARANTQRAAGAQQALLDAARVLESRHRKAKK